MKRKERIISSKTTTLDETKSLVSLLGKRVLSKSGEITGKITDVITTNEKIIGIMVTGSQKQFIGKEFFKYDAEDSIILTIDPVTLMIGKQVFDSEGKKLGNVIDIKRENADNNYTAIIIKKTLISKKILIPKKHIEVARKNILLNVPYENALPKDEY